MGYRDYDGAYVDYELPDPPVDESVTLRCVNPACPFYVPRGERIRFDGETWHPEIRFEYQGVIPHGATVSLYTEDAFTCAECGMEGREV